MSSNLNQYTDPFRVLARGLDKIDVEVYGQFKKDPFTPIIGLGDSTARICIFGRDPGRQEVEYQMPFIGAGGQKVRRELYQMRHGMELPDFNASVEIGSTVFWANTVPYKPIGNKAWSEKVKKTFKPLMSQVLLKCWSGTKVITLGREAFLWFAIGLDKSEKSRVKTFWADPARFEESFTILLTTSDGAERELEIFPLPHPSPLNATWYKKFPGLLRSRLLQTGYVD